MAAWSGLLALSGFRYDGPSAGVMALPGAAGDFRCFWSTPSGWGRFRTSGGGKVARFSLDVDHGKLAVGSCTIRSGAGATKAVVNDRAVAHQVRHEAKQAIFEFAEPLQIEEGGRLSLEVSA